MHLDQFTDKLEGNDMAKVDASSANDEDFFAQRSNEDNKAFLFDNNNSEQLVNKVNIPSREIFMLLCFKFFRNL